MILNRRQKNTSTYSLHLAYSYGVETSSARDTVERVAQRFEGSGANLIHSRLVLETLEPLSEDRKCFRLINGVLVERTVKDVVPALKTNQVGLKKVLEDLVNQYKTKQDDLDKWKVRRWAISLLYTALVAVC